jgi:hypothetical protein
MLDQLNKIWTVDHTQLSKTLVDAISAGKAVLHDGVAYWATGSGHTGVIQHLPFVETTQEVASNGLLQAAQSIAAATSLTTVLTAAASTTIILGAIVVQTRYLAGKINEVQQAVGNVARKIDEQNTVFYIERITSYLGDLDTCRFLMQDRQLSADAMELIDAMLPRIMSARNQNLGFISSLLTFAPDATLEHLTALNRFVHSALDVMPAGIHLEYLMAARSGKVVMAEQILVDGAERYQVGLEHYRTFLNRLHKDVVKGQGGDRVGFLATIDNEAKTLFNSEGNRALLATPAVRAAPFLRLVA